MTAAFLSLPRRLIPFCHFVHWKRVKNVRVALERKKQNERLAKKCVCVCMDVCVCVCVCGACVSVREAKEIERERVQKTRYEDKRKIKKWWCVILMCASVNGKDISHYAFHFLLDPYIMERRRRRRARINSRIYIIICTMSLYRRAHNSR